MGIRSQQNTSELRAECRNWYALRCLSISSLVKPRDLICAYERAGSPIGTSRLPSKPSPNPQQSANVVASLRNDRNFMESPLNTGRFNFHGKVMGSPAALKPLVPIGRGWCCLPAKNGAGAEKGCEFWYGNGGVLDGGGGGCCRGCSSWKNSDGPYDDDAACRNCCSGGATSCPPASVA